MSSKTIIISASIIILVNILLLIWYFYMHATGQLTTLDLSMVVINSMSLCLNIHTIITFLNHE